MCIYEKRAELKTNSPYSGDSNDGSMIWSVTKHLSLFHSETDCHCLLTNGAIKDLSHEKCVASLRQNFVTGFISYPAYAHRIQINNGSEPTAYFKDHIFSEPH